MKVWDLPEAESRALCCVGTFGREVQRCPHRAEWLLPFTGLGCVHSRLTRVSEGMRIHVTFM